MSAPLRRFVFLGAPGVGKGTFAKLILDRSHGRWRHLSPGDFIRAEMKTGSPVGRDFESFVKAGRLVPESLMTQYWLPNVAQTVEAARRETLSDSSSGDVSSEGSSVGDGFGVLLDGYPRTRDQCLQLDQALPGDPFLAVNITLRRDIAVMKLLGRCHCHVCGGNYNTGGLVDADYWMPPIAPKPVCPKSPTGGSCAETLSLRADDSSDVITARLEEHDKNMEPILDYYHQRGRLVEMNVLKGVRDIDRLWALMGELAAAHGHKP